MKYIKNNDVVVHNYIGQNINPGQYYQIQPAEEINWANDSILLTDIGSGKAVVAKDNSGTTDIIDVNDAIVYLKGLQVEISPNTPIHTYGVQEATALRARLIGSHNATITKGTTQDIDWLVPTVAYQGVNKQSLMNGIQYCAVDAEPGDKITFQAVDINNVLGYGPNVVLDEFGKDWYVMPNSSQNIVLYKAKLITGVYIRIKYTSVGTVNNVKLVCNLFRHIDMSINI